MGVGARWMRIGEFARRTSLSVHQLRHYDHLGVLPPGHVDSESGYRYYADAQVQAAQLIALLRSLDVPLADIRRLMVQPSAAPDVLASHRRRLEVRFEEAERRLGLYEELMRGGALIMQVERPVDLQPVQLEGVRVHQPTGQHVVLLASETHQVAIWIGPSEATGIALWLDGQRPERPMTFDLLAALCSTAQLDVRDVAVWQSPNNPQIFLAAIAVEGDGRAQMVDARPSDAINLALRVGAPIFVSRATLERAGRPKSEADVQPPTPPHHVRVVTEDGEHLGEATAFVEPGPGFVAHVFRSFEVTGLRPDEVRVRELADLKRLAVYPRPKPTPE